MIDLVKHPEAVLKAKHGDLFTVDGQPMVFEIIEYGDEVFLTVAETDNEDIDIDPEDKDHIQYNCPWQHVRHKSSYTALFKREHLVDILRSKQFIVN